MDEDPRLPVVVGVDASEASLRAARFAADEARRRRVPLRIVHAVSWPLDSLAIPPTDLDPAGRLRAGAETVAQWAADAVAGDDLEIRTVVEKGDPVTVLQVASADAQLVVVGSRGIGGVTGLLVGSTASGLVAHSHCPVVVLPEETAARVTGRQSVVVGVETSRGDADVLEFAFAAAAQRGTDLVAVHAWQDAVLETAFRSMGPLVDWAGLAAEEQVALSETLAGWREKAPDVAVREVVVRDRPARALLSAGLTAQLVVVGHRRRPALGSTTHAVLHRATCPVVIVPLPRPGR
ncbi:Nucleotide-binding universal stress protein, UspA family [Blastococcus aggregatus]|uniref:Nucleotide-binding universal stress protein, UspA family n=1 Tax=Blastococcus aggregatus TaxID=38502 RepID=A0A285V6N9_9ACTN|nr:universal stress protein [Blastococcus aggregatus]SOC49597.1 Nucleotide-binding universal stress protein, UspA family [Blastococcus aggregatus]